MMHPTCSIAECPDPCAAADLLLGEKKPVLSPAELVGAMRAYLTANGWEQAQPPGRYSPLREWTHPDHRVGRFLYQYRIGEAFDEQLRRDGVDVTG